jgi:DNA-binding transcriptional LysR family regulator
MHGNGMFEWDDARYFLAVHRAGSLSAAARQLGVNQSTMSRRLVALEARLRAKLFFRTREGFSIAPAGERLLAHAERMEDEAIAISREIAGQETRLTGVVRLTATDLFGARVITPLLVQFHALYPDIQLELDTDNRVRNLTKREADIAVRFGETAERGVVVRRVAEYRSALYASRGYLQRRGTPRGGELTGHDILGFAEPVHRNVEAIWLEERASGARMVLRTADTEVQLRAALDGMGIAALPCYAADAEPDLVRIEPPPFVARLPITIAMHEDLRSTARLRACADFLADGIRARAQAILGEAPPRTARGPADEEGEEGEEGEEEGPGAAAGASGPASAPASGRGVARRGRVR